MGKMTVLIVEDDPDKAQNVQRRLLASEFSEELAINVCRTLVATIKELETTYFDLVILDLRLPALEDNPSTDNSRAIIEQLRSGFLITPGCLLGLTAYDEAFDEEAKFYGQNLHAIAKYSLVDDEWMEIILNRLRFIKHWSSAYRRAASFSFASDLIIVTARHANEFKPIQKLIRWKSGPSKERGPFENSQLLTGTAAFGGVILSIGIFCVEEMGMAASAACTAHLIAALRPRLVLMLGMCCGFNHPAASHKCRLGDVIIAREAACWDEGRYEEDAKGAGFFANRAKPRSIDQELDSFIRSMLESHGSRIMAPIKKIWHNPGAKLLRESLNLGDELPELRCGMIVTGTSVVALREKGLEVSQRFPTAIGLEMEIYAVYTAVARSVGIKPLVLGVKGVADFGDGAKHSDFQSMASKLSFVVAAKIVEELFGRRSDITR